MANDPRCHDCGDEMTRLPTSHEPEGIRQDAICTYCHQMYMVTKAAAVKLTPANPPCAYLHAGSKLRRRHAPNRGAS